MKKTAVVFASLLAAAWVLGSPAAGSAQEKSSYLEAIGQADRQFQAGNFQNAAERYFFASQAAKERLDQARAFIGLSMSYFYLKDVPSAEKWAKKVLEVAPRLEVAVPAYPISFVQLFDRVRTEFFKGAIPPPPDEKAAATAPAPAVSKPPSAGVPPPVSDTAPDLPQPAGQPTTQTQTSAPAKQPSVKAPPEVSRPQAPVLPRLEARPGGRFQVMFHASSWTVDPVLNIVESLIKDKVGKEILRQLSTELRTKYFSLVESRSEQALDFDSSGSNFGLEIRYFSRGWGGTFSLGLAFDRTSIRLALSGKVKQFYTNSTSAEAEANGALTTDLSSTVLSFRWDISPASRLTPFLILGLGITPFEGRVSYIYAGTYDALIFKEGISGGEDMTLEELAEEQEFEMIDVFVVFQLALGLDIEIVRGLTGIIEAGLWNGFYLRGGLGYRF